MRLDDRVFYNPVHYEPEEVKYLKDYTLKKKEAVVDSIKEKLDASQSVVLIDYRGLTVAEVTDLRNQMRKAGVEYQVLKNTMIKRAADKAGIEGLDPILEGPTAVAFGINDPVAPAKILTKFAKDTKKITIKGGVLAGKAIDVAAVENLAKLPSKEELIAKMLGSLNAPVTGLVMVLSGVTSKFVRTLEAIRVQKEGQQ